MDRVKLLEDNLRKAACDGDFDLVIELLLKNTCINSRHAINGWTPLHWAAKRGRTEVVRLLLQNGADPTIETEKGETALSLASNAEIRHLLGGEMNGASSESNLPITPNYLKNPPLNPVKEDFSHWSNNDAHRRQPHQMESDELVLKVKIANGGDPDFIEIEIPKAELTYYSLLRVCCEELGVNASQVVRIRKLPNTMLRKDKDVQRLNQMQEVELVVTQATNVPHQPNGYKSIQLYKNQTILY